MPRTRERRGNVLVVDDERGAVAMLSELLAFAGWRTQPAYTGAEALSAIRWASFDCIIMDLRMPGLDGVTAIEAILAERPDVPIVVVTALTGAQPQAALKAGARAILPKPFERQQLLDALDEATRSQAIIPHEPLKHPPAIGEGQGA